MLQIRNALLPNGQLVCLQIDFGTIIGITFEPVLTTSLDLDFNAHGWRVFPGGIDLHVHDRFPGNQLVETIMNLILDALAGGTTTICKMPNTNPSLVTFEGLLDNLVAIGEQAIQIFAWMGALPDNLDEFSQAALWVPRMCGIKVYGSHTVGTLYVPHGPGRWRIAERSSEKNIFMAVHAQDQELIYQNRSRLGRSPVVADHCVIQDAQVELSSVKQFLEIQRDTKCRMLFCHISSPGSLELIQDAKQSGAEVFAEVCAPHIAPFDSTWLARSDGWRFKMNPSPRAPNEVAKMREYVCTPGWVDVVSTDHAPHPVTLEAKLADDYDKIPSGMPGVRTRLLLMFDFVSKGNMDIDHFVNLTSANAARLIGLPNDGWIGKGANANLVIIDPDHNTAIDDKDMFTRCGWSPFHGFTFNSRIRATVARGKLYTF